MNTITYLLFAVKGGAKYKKMKTMDGNPERAHASYDIYWTAAIYPITPSSPGEATDEWATGRKNKYLRPGVQITEMQSEGWQRAPFTVLSQQVR